MSILPPNRSGDLPDHRPDKPVGDPLPVGFAVCLRVHINELESHKLEFPGLEFREYDLRLAGVPVGTRLHDTDPVVKRRHRPDAPGAVEEGRCPGEQEIASRHRAPVDGIDDLDERMVPLLPLCPLQPLGGLNFVDSDRKPPVSGAVNDQTSPRRKEYAIVSSISPRRPARCLKLRPMFGSAATQPSAAWAIGNSPALFAL